MTKPNQVASMHRRDLLAGALAGAAITPFATARALSVRGAERRRVLRFAHLTDTHVQRERAAGEGFAKCLHHAQSQADAPELIIFGGDNVMNVDGDGRATAVEQLAVWNSTVRNECSLPHHTVIGNHDVLAGHPVDGKKWATDAYGLDGRFYSFERAGWKFVVLDSTMPEARGYKGRLDETQFEWLTDELADTPERTPVCVVSHIPIIAPCAYFDGDNEKTSDWVVPGAWMHIDARRIKGLFHEHPNVKLCLSGHIHLADTATYLGVTYACNGAVCGGWWKGPNQEFAPAYALVDLYDDGTCAVQLVEYGWEARE